MCEPYEYFVVFLVICVSKLLCGIHLSLMEPHQLLLVILQSTLPLKVVMSQDNNVNHNLVQVQHHTSSDAFLPPFSCPFRLHYYSLLIIRVFCRIIGSVLVYDSPPMLGVISQTNELLALLEQQPTFLDCLLNELDCAG